MRMGGCVGAASVAAGLAAALAVVAGAYLPAGVVRAQPVPTVSCDTPQELNECLLLAADGADENADLVRQLLAAGADPNYTGQG